MPQNSGSRRRLTQKRSSRRDDTAATTETIDIKSANDARVIDELVGRGPITLILVYSTTCPHCHTYMPMWEKLCAMKNKKANMVRMESSVYQSTPMSNSTRVESVPTVLFVDKEGKVRQGENIRDMDLMKKVVTNGISEEAAASGAVAGQAETESEVEAPVISAKVPLTQSESFKPVIPGTVLSDNDVPVAPASLRQTGGSPWAAFLTAAATQAGPAAVLLGAYSMIPKRSSGLGPASRLRKTRRRGRRSNRG